MSRSHGYDDPRCEVIRARANASLTGPSGEREFHEHAFRDVEMLLDILDEAQEQIDEAEHNTEHAFRDVELLLDILDEAQEQIAEAEHNTETVQAEADSACEEANRCAAERDELRKKLDAVMKVVA